MLLLLPLMLLMPTCAALLPLRKALASAPSPASCRRRRTRRWRPRCPPPPAAAPPGAGPRRQCQPPAPWPPRAPAPGRTHSRCLSVWGGGRSGGSGPAVGGGRRRAGRGQERGGGFTFGSPRDQCNFASEPRHCFCCWVLLTARQQRGCCSSGAQLACKEARIDGILVRSGEPCRHHLGGNGDVSRRCQS